jgi:putative transposase
MPRKHRNRLVSDDSMQHIVQRGLNRIKIFNTESDYEFIKQKIRKYLSIYKVSIHNYCFMPNHIHILVYTKIAKELSKFMQAVSLSHSYYYRKKYKYSGYLWQGRYKSFPIEKDSYLLECARYIERNPIRAKRKIVSHLSQYKWSSYNFYAHGIKDDIITPNPLYQQMGKTPKERQNNYRDYVLTDRPYEQIIDEFFGL